MRKVSCMSFMILISMLFMIKALSASDFDTLSKRVMANDFKGVEELLSSGIDINTQNEISGSTVLILTCSLKGFEDMVEFLLNRGADVSIRSRDSSTALIWAAGNSKKYVELLLSKGADINVKAVDGRTALIESVFGILAEIITLEVPEVLIKAGASINDTIVGGDVSGWTALMFATNNGRPDLVEFLISNGADVNHVAADGTTALMWVSRWGYKEIAELLINHEADVNLMAKDGSSALSLAIDNEHNELAQMLRAAGADE